MGGKPEAAQPWEPSEEVCGRGNSELRDRDREPTLLFYRSWPMTDYVVDLIGLRANKDIISQAPRLGMSSRAAIEISVS